MTTIQPKQEKSTIALLGVPVGTGAGQLGCAMGPAALRTAGIVDCLRDLGHPVRDLGDVAIDPDMDPEDPSVAGNARAAREIAAWTRAGDAGGYAAAKEGRLPIFMGGDHSLAMGTINAMARVAREQGRPLHILWLDAHSDFNTPATSPSGNMHGMPVAALTGEDGLDFLYDGMDRVMLPPANFHMFGIRSVDAEERALIAQRGVDAMDMRTIDENGVSRLITRVLDQVAAENAMLHVSLDVDCLDPSIAPGVGTTVPGGATWREAHLVMEMLYDSGLVTSLDLAELNPFLDERGRSALLLVDLVSSLFGKKIIERQKIATFA